MLRDICICTFIFYHESIVNTAFGGGAIAQLLARFVVSLTTHALASGQSIVTLAVNVE